MVASVSLTESVLYFFLLFDMLSNGKGYGSRVPPFVFSLLVKVGHTVFQI